MQQISFIAIWSVVVDLNEIAARLLLFLKSRRKVFQNVFRTEAPKPTNQPTNHEGCAKWLMSFIAPFKVKNATRIITDFLIETKRHWKSNYIIMVLE